MLTRQQIEEYLQRLEYGKSLPLQIDTLKSLQWAHMTHIPYENLDLLNGRPLSLDMEDLFTKIVGNRRGGYCFELQGLYGYLLKSIGFSVTQYAGRFMDEPGVIQMRRHRVLVVELNGRRYLTDVGVRSESPRCPLELTEGKLQTDGVCQYRFGKDGFYGWVLMQKEEKKDWKPIYGFTEEIQIDSDYIMPSFFCEKHPDSTFNKFMKISIFYERCNLTIVDGVFKVYRDGAVQKRIKLRDDLEARQALEKYFGIVPPDGYTFT